MSEFINLHTKRLIIRDHVFSDLNSHHLIFSDDEVMYYLPEIKTNTMDESKENLEESIIEINKEKRTKYFLRIEDKEQNHIGEIGYTVTKFTPFGKMVHLGYFIHKKFRQKGYVTESVEELLRFAFEENGVFRISTGCLKENTASERVMLKTGFTKEAEFKNIQFHDNKMKDRVEYRMLKNEWIEQQNRRQNEINNV